MVLISVRPYGLRESATDSPRTIEIRRCKYGMSKLLEYQPVTISGKFSLQSCTNAWRSSFSFASLWNLTFSNNSGFRVDLVLDQLRYEYKSYRSSMLSYIVIASTGHLQISGSGNPSALAVDGSFGSVCVAAKTSMSMVLIRTSLVSGF